MSSDYDKIASLFEDLQSYLVRLKVLEGKVPPSPELVAIITEILASVLVLLGFFTKYIQTKRTGKYPTDSCPVCQSHLVTKSPTVKTLRSLVSGEDVDLRAARDRFHKLVEREEGVVRNAIFVSVTEVKSNVQSAHADGQKGVAELKLGIGAAHRGVTNLLLTGISDKIH